MDTTTQMRIIARNIQENARVARDSAELVRAKAITRAAVAAGELAGLSWAANGGVGQYAIGASKALVEASAARTALDANHWIDNAAAYAHHAVEYLGGCADIDPFC